GQSLGFRWQRQDHLESGAVIFKPKRPPMQSCDGRNEAQSEPTSGLRPACLKPDKAAENAIAIRAWYARPAIGDDDFGHVSLRLGDDAHFRLGAVAALNALRRPIFDGVVNEIGDGLSKQLTIGAHKDWFNRVRP